MDPQMGDSDTALLYRKVGKETIQGGKNINWERQKKGGSHECQ
jgi:hypothetical protein